MDKAGEAEMQNATKTQMFVTLEGTTTTNHIIVALRKEQWN